ncbi:MULTISPECIES: CtsR family transcriptional regulator [Acidaminococcus]|uniref:CtsR family transcriptional regulator n=1 Tax=Acidaminococcus TaxID=904 RepID=UPI0025919F1B|nr:CtsR family transcriptional regulator [Acidaminococcus sp.]MDO5596833.1 CtsR family transcriptional regulator [Acidaminococcus sp.]
MRNIADAIEEFIISELFANEQDAVSVKRSQLAEKLSCAPSQITYTLTTRFTPERGYEVESKRGNGGFIRIIRLHPHQSSTAAAHPALPAAREGKSSGQLVQALLTHKLVTLREARLMDYFLHVLGDHVSEKDKEQLIRSAFQLLQEDE